MVTVATGKVGVRRHRFSVFKYLGWWLLFAEGEFMGQFETKAAAWHRAVELGADLDRDDPRMGKIVSRLAADLGVNLGGGLEGGEA
jgi:hypothetical protein